MASSEMLRRVALVRTDDSEVTIVVPGSPTLDALMKKALSSSETSVLARATRRNIPEDTILHIFESLILNHLKTHKTCYAPQRRWNVCIISQIKELCSLL
jgi:hypothetical protein